MRSQRKKRKSAKRASRRGRRQGCSTACCRASGPMVREPSGNTAFWFRCQVRCHFRNWMGNCQRGQVAEWLKAPHSKSESTRTVCSRAVPCRPRSLARNRASPPRRTSASQPLVNRPVAIRWQWLNLVSDFYAGPESGRGIRPRPCSGACWQAGRCPCLQIAALLRCVCEYTDPAA
jgi:hypothetical protein